MDLGDTLFVEIMLAKNDTKHGVLTLVTKKMMDRDKMLSAKMKKIIRAVISRRGLNMQVCR